MRSQIDFCGGTHSPATKINSPPRLVGTVEIFAPSRNAPYPEGVFHLLGKTKPIVIQKILLLLIFVAGRSPATKINSPPRPVGMVEIFASVVICTLPGRNIDMFCMDVIIEYEAFGNEKKLAIRSRLFGQR